MPEDAALEIATRAVRFALTSLQDKQKKEEDALRAEAPTTSEQPNEETGYTPGPWSVMQRLSASENHKGFFIIPEDRHPIGEVYPLDEDAREGSANASLIAKTPEMLRLLIDTYNEHMHFGWGFEEHHDAITELLISLKALPVSVLDRPEWFGVSREAQSGASGNARETTKEEL